MATLYLLRHARASWPQPGGKDFDRPLEQSGRDDAVATGLRMANDGLFPAMAICSTARRARETLDEIVVGMDTSFPVRFDERLYSADATGYMDIIRNAGTQDPVLIIGHNPMMEDTTAMLADQSSKDDRRRLIEGFPVCGLAILDFDTPLADIAASGGKLRAFLKPGDI